MLATMLSRPNSHTEYAGSKPSSAKERTIVINIQPVTIPATDSANPFRSLFIVFLLWQASLFRGFNFVKVILPEKSLFACKISYGHGANSLIYSLFRSIFFTEELNLPAPIKAEQPRLSRASPHNSSVRAYYAQVVGLKPG